MKWPTPEVLKSFLQFKIFQEEPLEATAGDRDFLAIMGKEKVVFEEFR